MGKDMQVQSQIQAGDVAIHGRGRNPQATRVPHKIGKIFISSGTIRSKEGKQEKESDRHLMSI